MKLKLLLLLFTFVSCTERVKTINFKSVLTEPCLIVNTEQDNTIEGEYLTVSEIKNDSILKIKLPNRFFVTQRNCSNWLLGWGSDTMHYDTGTENLREIISIDSINNTLILGNLKKGKGYPKKKQRIIFINKNPSGFQNYKAKPIINVNLWPEFAGKSISFSSIVFDSILHKWIMLVNECDTSHIQIYAAQSVNLIDWTAANNGNPILTSTNFKTCKWAGTDVTGKIKQTPFISDILYHNKKWFIFLDGYNSKGKQQIGLAVSDSSIIGNYTVFEKPIITVGTNNQWNDEACYYAKVKKYKNGFILFYDGKNKNGYERLGMAFSKDLIYWEQNKNNPIIDEHTGWRSSVKCTEPNFIDVKNDSIFVMIAGVKKSKANFWHHYITNRMYKDISGNVEQAQLGMYLSTDGGNHFMAHKNNPIFINDYANKYENAHMGGNFKLIHTDTMDYIFYQAKSTYEGLKYTIMLRTKKVN